MAVVHMFIKKFGKKVHIEDTHPLAVAQRQLDGVEDSQIEKEPAGVADEADDGSDEEQDEFNVDTASYRQLQKEATKRGIAANQSADILRAELT